MVRSFFGDPEAHRRRRAEAASFARRPRRGARRARRARRSRRTARGARPALVRLGGSDLRSLPRAPVLARGELDGAASAIEEALGAHSVFRSRSSSPARCSRRARSCDAATSGASPATRSTRASPSSTSSARPLSAERARDERRRLGLQKGSSDELTPSERTVASLAASGLTNRQIAERIFVSPRPSRPTSRARTASSGSTRGPSWARTWRPASAPRRRETPDAPGGAGPARSRHGTSELAAGYRSTSPNASGPA